MPIPEGVRGENKNYTIMKRKLFTFLLAAVASIGLTRAEIYSGTCGATGNGSNLTWSLNTEDSTLIISGTGAMANWSTYGYSPWYNYRSYIVNITLGNRVTSIGAYAFYNCTALTSIDIPNSFTSIGDYAFAWCSSLTSANIPSDLTIIGNNIFCNCSSLASVNIPNSVTNIKSRAFLNCYSLTSLVIPNSVTSIGSQAFCNCHNLTSVIIPNSVTSIGSLAFNYIPNIEYSGTATGGPWGAKCVNGYIDGWLVYNDESQTQLCACLTAATGEIIIPNSVTSIGNSAFGYCDSLTSVIIPNSVTSIGEQAFGGCLNITSIDIPNSVTSIGYWAFGYVPNIAYSGTATGSPWGARCINGVIEDWLIYSDSSKTQLCACSTAATGVLIIPDSVTSIGKQAFYQCDSLTSVIIPNSVRIIGENNFIGCSALTSIYVKGEIPARIDYNAFEDPNSCPIYIPCGTYSDYVSARIAYADRFQYEAMDFPYSLTCLVNIEEAGHVQTPNACSDTIITAVSNNGYHFVQWSDGIIENPRTIHLFQDTTFSAVFAIDKSGTCGKDLTLAWEYDEENKALSISGSGELTENYSYFIVMKRANKVAFAEGVTNIGEYAFNNCSNLTAITLPQSVTNIANYAFYECSNMTTIYEQSTTPPTIYSNSFESSESIDVYVPFGGETRYKSAQVWKDMTIHSPAITQEVVACVTSCIISIDVENTMLQSCNVVGGEIFAGNTLELIGLEPETEYNKTITLTSNTSETDTISVSFTTTALELTTQQPTIASSNTAILLAETNMADAEVNCGFEWRRDNQPEGMASTKVYAPVANGVMAGRLKGLRDDVYYKYRAFYESSEGNKYYGDWQYIFTGDNTVEFDPVMYTYTAQAVTETTAILRGYALAGSVDFTEQGFEYWVESRVIPEGASGNAYNSVIGEHQTIQASGISMKVTLTDLDEGSVYKYRSYAVVNGQTVYGAEQSFTTRGEYFYTVTFVDYDGTILGTDKVHYGTSAIAPDDPTREGYYFSGWDNDFSNVIDDLTVTATYSISTALQEIIVTERKAQKLLRNCQLFILRDGKTYTIQGQEVK